MKYPAKTHAAACILLAACGYTTAASAQSAETDPPGAIEISGNVGVVSDYRFRGLSLSDRDPAIQGGIDVSHKSGLFVGTWASSIADYGGSNMELDLYGGYASSAAGLDYSITALGYVYPGGHDVNYFELKGTVGKTIGPASLELEVSWVPDQSNYPGDNVYIAAGAEVGIPNTPLTVHARAGRESSDFIKKWDWEAGVAYSFGSLTASVAYVDTNYSGINEAGRLGRAGVVASLLAEF
jgi:uncharacterized protein (TIGR02001 family)